MSLSSPPIKGEWLLPMWSDRSRRLSAWLLGEDGALSIVSIDGESPDTLEFFNQAGIDHGRRQSMGCSSGNRQPLNRAGLAAFPIRGSHLLSPDPPTHCCLEAIGD